jgi:magnesium chelatase family protein
MVRFCRTFGTTLLGARAALVDVQVSLPPRDGEVEDTTFRIVGLPDSALREGRERIRGAVRHGGWPWPWVPVTVNLAPAGSRKEGPSLDLAIALAVLAAHGTLGPSPSLARLLCLGELGLDGSVRPVRGVLAAVEAARRGGLEAALVPRANAEEAAAVRGLPVVAVGTLREAVGHVSGAAPLPAETPREWTPEPWRGSVASEVRGQGMAVRAAVLAAVGGHNLLLTGPPGAGKTLLARNLRHLMAPLTYDEALEVSRIHSVAGRLTGGLVRSRPFRAPHHTTSLAGLVGGGAVLRPGEISLAHLGVLFLDELPEFPRPSLEALRQPLEDGRLVLGRAAGHVTFPADVVLVAAMNPCPCGWEGVGQRCTCPPHLKRSYAARVSGPLRDRFDLHVFVKPVEAKTLVEEAAKEPVSEEALRSALARQAERAVRLRLPRPQNARIPGALLPDGVDPTPGASHTLVDDATKLGMTGRGVHRALRVARTIADLEGHDRVERDDVLLALNYRAP